MDNGLVFPFLLFGRMILTRDLASDLSDQLVKQGPRQALVARLVTTNEPVTAAEPCRLAIGCLWVAERSGRPPASRYIGRLVAAV
jgi:hypothetical protein